MRTNLWYQVIDEAGKKGSHIEPATSARFVYAFAKRADDGYLSGKYFRAAALSSLRRPSQANDGCIGPLSREIV